MKWFKNGSGRKYLRTAFQSKLNTKSCVFCKDIRQKTNVSTICASI